MPRVNDRAPSHRDASKALVVELEVYERVKKLLCAVADPD